MFIYAISSSVTSFKAKRYINRGVPFYQNIILETGGKHANLRQESELTGTAVNMGPPTCDVRVPTT